MSTVPHITSEQAGERIDRILDILEGIVNDKTSLKIRLHSFAMTLGLALSLATAPTVGVTPSITSHAGLWAIGAVFVGLMQGIGLLVGREPCITISAVATSMLCFAVAFMTMWDAPTSFVVTGFLSLGVFCLLPTLRSLFNE